MSKFNKISNFNFGGIESTTLNKVCDFQNGFAFKSEKFQRVGLPIVRISNIIEGSLLGGEYVYFNQNDYKEDLKKYIVKADSILIAMSGATTGKIAYNSSKNDYYINQRVGMFVPNPLKLNNRFLFHWLLSKTNEIIGISSGIGTQPNLSSTKLMEMQIQLPALETQKKIACILDSFTELIAELKTQLIARKKQYEHYRVRLLSFNNSSQLRDKLNNFIVELCSNSVEYKKMWEITTWDKKFNSVAKHKQPKTIKYNHYLASELKKFSKENGDVKILTTNKTDLWASESDVQKTMSMGEVVCIPWGGNPIVQYYNGKFITGDNRIATSNNKNILNNKFLYYFLENNIDLIASFYRGAGIQHPSMNDILDIEIPLPPLKIQEEIVRILDKFDELCNDTSKGLPAEIKMRQIQYEYYREKLFAFEEEKFKI